MSKQEEREAINIIGVDHDVAPIISHVQKTINMMAAEMRDDGIVTGKQIGRAHV